MGLFKKLAKMARESNAWASQGSSGYSDSDEYEDEESDEEVYPVCHNCGYYFNRYCLHHAMNLDVYQIDTHGCSDFYSKK